MISGTLTPAYPWPLSWKTKQGLYRGTPSPDPLDSHSAGCMLAVMVLSPCPSLLAELVASETCFNWLGVCGWGSFPVYVCWWGSFPVCVLVGFTPCVCMCVCGGHSLCVCVGGGHSVCVCVLVGVIHCVCVCW